MTGLDRTRRGFRVDARRRREPLSSGSTDGDQRRARRGGSGRGRQGRGHDGRRQVLLQRAGPGLHGGQPRRVRGEPGRRARVVRPGPGVSRADRRRGAGPRVRRRRDAGAGPRPDRHARRPRLLLSARGRSRNPVHRGHERVDPLPAADRDRARGDDDRAPLRRRGRPAAGIVAATGAKARCSTSRSRGPRSSPRRPVRCSGRSRPGSMPRSSPS